MLNWQVHHCKLSSVQLNPAVPYLNYQLPIYTRLSGVLSYYNKIAEQKIPAVLSNFALPEDLKGIFNSAANSVESPSVLKCHHFRIFSFISDFFLFDV